MIWREYFIRQRKRPWLSEMHYLKCLTQVYGSVPAAMWEIIAVGSTENKGRVWGAPDLSLSGLVSS